MELQKKLDEAKDGKRIYQEKVKVQKKELRIKFPFDWILVFGS